MKYTFKRTISLALAAVMVANMCMINVNAAKDEWITVINEKWNSISDTWTSKDSAPEIKTLETYLIMRDDVTDSSANGVIGSVLTSNYVDPAAGYSVEFAAKVNSWTDGPQSVYGGKVDANSLGVQLFPSAGGRFMFTIEQDKITTSTANETWANAVAYPSDFDASAWHTWKITVNADKTVSISVDGNALDSGSAAVQNADKNYGDGQLKLYTAGSAEKPGSVDVDWVKVLKNDGSESFTEEFAALDTSVWSVPRDTDTIASVSGESVLNLKDSSYTINGIQNPIDLSGCGKFKITFDAKLNSYTAGHAADKEYTTLGVKVGLGDSQVSFAVENNHIDLSAADNAWGVDQDLDAAAYNTGAWQNYELLVDKTTGVVDVSVNGTQVTSGAIQKGQTGNFLELYCRGSQDQAADAYLDNLVVSYWSSVNLPTWEPDAQLMVKNTADGFEINWPAAAEATSYDVKIADAEPVNVTETTYTATGLERIFGLRGGYEISVVAKNEAGTSQETLTGKGNPVFDPASGEMDIREVVAGKNNGGTTKYTNYRIPGMVVTNQDTVIMYYEARMSASDWGNMDILAFRSTDGGETFGEPIMLAAGAEIGATMNNPIIIVGNDENNTLHFLYCVEYGVCKQCNDSATSACPHGPGVFYRKSIDDGLTWSDPVNISDSTNPDMHNVIATGPGHGIALSDGTLIATVWLVKKSDNSSLTSHHPGNVATLYSKDNGNTWHMGELVPNTNGQVVNPNETMCVETSDGRVMLNIRSGGGGYRALAWSKTGYSGWTEMEYHKDLIDPTCMGSVGKYDIGGDPYTLLQTNCESRSGRNNLVLKGSVDDGKTWTIRKVIDPGAAGYSDVAVDSKGTIYVLYEVNAGLSDNLARLNYRSLVEDSLAKLKNIEVEGASDSLVFDGSNDYILNATNGTEVKIKVETLHDGAQVTINGDPYIAGEAYTYTVELGADPVEIVVVNGAKTETYTLTFLPKAPQGSLVMHLNGGTFDDQTIYKNNVVASEDVTVVTEGARDDTGMYSMTGANTQEMKIDPTNGINVGTGDFTVSAWINPDTLEGVHFTWWYGTCSAGQPQFWARTNGGNLQANFGSDGSETTLTAKDVLQAGKWAFVTVVRTGMNYYLYVDGELKSEATTDFVRNINASNVLYLGTDQNSRTRSFDGYMDEFMFFNYALTAEDVADLMANGSVTSDHRDILDFSIENVKGIIEGTNITVKMPAGTDVTALAPTIQISEKATVSPASGIAQNFTKPVIYTVTSEKGNTEEYTVTVIVEEGIPVEKVELNQTQAQLQAGESVQLTATVTPETAADSTLTWTSNNQNVATVVDGLVTAVADGDAVIRVSTVNGKFDECTIKVHTHSYTETVIAPTCTEKGYTEYVCDCGHSYVDDYVEALGHEFGEWTLAKQPTCTHQGEERRTCTVCSYYENRAIKAEGHSFVETIIYPTFHANGYTLCECTKCDYTYTKDIVQSSCPSTVFDDVDDVWYHDGVDYMVANKHMVGVSQTRFAPNKTATRAELVMILYQIAGNPDVQGMENPFVDVTLDDWYADAVIWAAHHGIVKGVSENRFAPHCKITREQIATILYSYAKAEKVETNYLQKYTDVNKISSYAVDAMNWAAANKLISGTGATILSPASNATRGQIATILMQYLENVAK